MLPIILAKKPSQIVVICIMLSSKKVHCELLVFYLNLYVDCFLHIP